MYKKIIYLIVIISVLLTGCYDSYSKSTANQDTRIQYYFTKAGDHPEKALVAVINSARSSLDVAIYSITQKDIVKAIIEAQRRGVKVRLITDRQESNSKSEMGALQLFKDRGIPIKINCHQGLMHMKVSIVDDNIVTTGSFNYTEQASTQNDEVLVIINSPNSVKEFENQFQNMWSDNENFQDY
jgi:phosphatidylserine/phosphatidylglycerophosphate/cardiolipin synthase-like enzyme